MRTYKKIDNAAAGAADKKVKRNRITAICLLVILLCLGAFAVWKERQAGQEVDENIEVRYDLPIAEKGISQLSSDDNLVIQVLNVGQGLCILGKQGEYVFLYDAGPASSSAELVDYLKAQGIDRIDAAFVSHFDSDHIAGFYDVIDNLAVDVFCWPDYDKKDSQDEALKAEAKRRGSTMYDVSSGDVITLGECRFEVWGPVQTAEDSNSNSLVINVSAFGFSVLLTGDATKEEEKTIIQAKRDGSLANFYRVDKYGNNQGLTTDVLIAAHHGSSGSSSEDFLKMIKAKYAAVSAGAGNEYGHPNGKTLKRLKAAGMEILRTDVSGAITFVLSADGILTE